jgi:hypothetical protein
MKNEYNQHTFSYMMENIYFKFRERLLIIQNENFDGYIYLMDIIIISEKFLKSHKKI